MSLHNVELDGGCCWFECEDSLEEVLGKKFLFVCCLVVDRATLSPSSLQGREATSSVLRRSSTEGSHGAHLKS